MARHISYIDILKLGPKEPDILNEKSREQGCSPEAQAKEADTNYTNSFRQTVE
jgi:hypothetical protein